jgi:hypothetical protein
MEMTTCLYRYIASAIHKSPDQLRGHSAEWESWCIYQILTSLGYTVTALNWKDKNINITQTYDVVWDAIDLRQLKPAFRDDTIKILHLTGADNVWRNKQGLSRVADVNRRRNTQLPYVRFLHNPDAVYENIELADFVTLLGNEFTLHTYPERYWDKIKLMNVSATR